MEKYAYTNEGHCYKFNGLIVAGIEGQGVILDVTNTDFYTD